MTKRNGKKLAELVPHQDPQDRIAVPTADPPEVEGEEIHAAALWRVEGEESTNSGGGVVFFYVLTGDCLELPDVVEAHVSLTEGCSEYGLYNVRRVEKVADHFTEDDETAYEHGCVNQTGRPMTPDVAAMIASLMRSLKSAEEELGEARLELRRRDRGALAVVDGLPPSALEFARQHGFLVVRSASPTSGAEEVAYHRWCDETRRPFVVIREDVDHALIRLDLGVCSPYGEYGPLGHDDLRRIKERARAVPDIGISNCCYAGSLEGTWYGIPLPLARDFAAFLLASARRDRPR